MRKTFIFFFCALLVNLNVFSQNDTIRNLILMIPDGTSTSMLSIARWYKAYQANATTARLALDPHLCGLVNTFSSDAPIGDSAPTTSCYMTGMPSLAGTISIYPPATEHDLVPVDVTRAYQPLMTVFEAARLTQDKAVGLIATSYITDATPADCMSHFHNRGNREVLTKELIHNGVDVLLGGGNKEAKQYESYLKEQGYAVYFDDLQGFRKNTAAKVCALFGEYDMPYHIDADTNAVPSLAEMTETALQCLSKNENGFVLMVEGSKIDWAAHDNDAATMVDEFLEFDKAVATALQFAKNDRHTVVVILPDHGNSAISIGNSRSSKTYKHLSLEEIIKPLTTRHISAEKIGDSLAIANDSTRIQTLFKRHFDYELSDEEWQEIMEIKSSSQGNAHYKTVDNLTKCVTKILNANTYIGFTTHGHTGEDVFLAIYHPQHDLLTGMHTNSELNRYLCRQLRLPETLEQLTQRYYARHQDVFQGYDCVIEKLHPDNEKDINARLIVKNKKQTIEIESFTNYFLLNGKRVDLPSVVVYMDKNNTFYLPEELGKYLK